MSFGEAGQTKGAIEVSVPKMKMEFLPLDVRPMVDLGKLDCKGLSNSDIVAAAEQKVRASAPDGKVLRLKLLGIPRSQADGLDYRRVRAAADGAIHFELRVEPDSETPAAQAAGATIGDLRSEFADYLGREAVERLDKTELLRLGRGYIEGALDTGEG